MFVLLEWMRLFFLTGFTWNPAGLALAGSRYSIQWAAVFGIYGLTFWVIWTNLSALALLRSPSFKKCAVWLFLALFPHGFGLAHEIWVKTFFQAKKEIWAAAVDTSLKVEEKNRDRLHPEAYVPPLIQWERVWSYLDPKCPLDLIILPEAAFPYGTDEPHCPLDLLKERWRIRFGAEEADFPPLEAPYAELCTWKGQPQWMATNAFFAQTLANRFKAHVIVGFDYDETDNRRRNSAFLFRPKSSFERYDKRILAPVGEYIPLQNVEWIAEFLLREFGIGGSFEPGTEAKVFQSHVPIGVPICLEEMYSGLARDLRRRGAELFVSLSNDVWFPGTRLAKQHLDHGRIRAVENGVFLLRSSNMGWTGAIDCFGHPIKMRSPGAAGAIYFSVPAFSYPTLFSLWGDNAILVVSIGAIAVFALRVRRRKSCP
jgi:apolipoprotein N-acyltransferase